MNLCYLYNKKINYPHAKKLLASFESHESIDISTSQCTKEYGIYVVDPGELSKEITTHIRTIFKERPSALIFMVSNGGNSATFYQLAYLLKAKSIITSKQDPAKVVSLIKSAYANHVYENKSLYVGRFVADTLCYMIFKGSELHYASDTLLKNFGCSSLEEIKQKVCSKLDLSKLLGHEDILVDARQIFDDEKLDIVKSIYKNGEYLVTLERYDYAQLHCSSEDDLSTRLKFIDFLRERLMEKDGSRYSLITIRITNFKKIGNIIGKSELESFINKFLKRSKELLSKYLIFSEYNQDFFVAMYKDTDFAELETKAQEYYTQMQEFFKEFNFKIDIALHVMELNNVELGVALSILDAIRANKISKKEIIDKKIKYIGRYNENMSDKEIISLLLDSSYINDMDLKLLNVYKGMIIDSPTKILKKDRNAIYVVVKQIQGAIMSIQKETILRSDAFDKDIKARVAFVDKKRKIAKLENFKVIDDDTLYKDNCRVDFAKKNMAIVSLIGTKVSAEILDISAKSISLKMKKIKILDKIINKKVEITFTIPTKRTHEGEIKITEMATVSYVDCRDEDSCRMVCDFDPASKNKNIIIEYVHNRQVEIVEELKKMNY